MDGEVVRLIAGVVGFFVFAIIAIRWIPLAGVGMIALGVALGLVAIRAHDFARVLHMWTCDEACVNQGGWQFTETAWQWNGLWAAARTGTVAVWLATGLAAAGAALAIAGRTVAGARRMYVLASAAMAVALVAFGTFAVIVAPLGEQYGI